MPPQVGTAGAPGRSGASSAVVALRDIIVTEPDVKLESIMNSHIIYVYDDDSFDTLTEVISKYNLLAIPVVDRQQKLVGMVIIDDIVFSLLKHRNAKL